MSATDVDEDVQALLSATSRFRTLIGALLNRDYKTIDVSEFKKISIDMYKFLYHRGLIHENREWNYWLYFFTPLFIWLVKTVIHKISQPSVKSYDEIFSLINSNFDLDFNAAFGCCVEVVNDAGTKGAASFDGTCGNELLPLCDILDVLPFLTENLKHQTKMVFNTVILRNSILSERLKQRNKLEDSFGNYLDFKTAVKTLNTISDLIAGYMK